MSNFISGSIDHRITVGTANAQQELFTSIFRFLNGPLRSASYCELISYHTGSAAGGGTNYHDQTSPFGENAFAVFKFVTGSVLNTTSLRNSSMYVLIQWAYTAQFGAAPGSPALLESNPSADGVGWQVAWTDNDHNPWAGSMNANGNDTKGSPVWVTSGSTLRILPRSNNAGGTHSAIRQNCANIHGITTTPVRYHMFADRDNFALFFDVSDDANYDGISMFGIYDPLPGISGSILNPMFMINTTSLPIVAGTTYGPIAGNSATADGGICPVISSSGVPIRGFIIDRYERIMTTTMQPNAQYSSSIHNEFRIPLISNEVDTGMLGYIKLFPEVYNSSNHNVYADGSKILIGKNGGFLAALPWVSGSAVIPSTSTREGRLL